MHLSGRPVAAFDPEGLIFAAGINSEMLKLYDLRSFDKVGVLLAMLAIFLSTIDWSDVKFTVKNKNTRESTKYFNVNCIDIGKSKIEHNTVPTFRIVTVL